MFEKAVQFLKNKAIILYPTDTVWGIGGDATDPEVVKKIYTLKKREDHKALIVFVNSLEMLGNYVEAIPKTALKFIEDSQPITIVYSKAKNLAQNLLGADGSIGIRIPKNEFCQNLIENFGKPIISTSANLSNTPTPTHFDSISKEILEGVDYIVPLPQNNATSQPSRVIKIDENGAVTVIRP